MTHLHDSIHLKKSRLILSNLTDKQKEGLKDGSIGVAALISGASMYKLFGANSIAIEEPEVCIEDVIPESMTTAPSPDVFNSEVITIETDVPFAQGATDHLSFEDSFAAAREQVGPGAFFEWRGQTYNTYYADEWNGMTTEQQNDYAAQVRSQSNLESYETYRKEDIAIDTNQDGVDDVILSDINNNGQLDIKEIDLNGDGHIDVIHVPYVEKTAASDMPQEAEPVYGVHSDEEYDAVVVDHNHDGYADTIIMDFDKDGEGDAVAYNLDYDNDLDIVIIDENHDGLDTNDNLEIVEHELNMDEFIILDEEEVQEIKQASEDTAEETLNDGDFYIDESDFEGIEI